MKQFIKKHLNHNLEKLAGLRVESVYAHGRHDDVDINNSGKKIDTIIDVGANIGQTAIKFRQAFPRSEIYCFEPVQHIFQQLKDNTANLTNVFLYDQALGSEIGEAEIYLTTHETISSLKKPEFVKATQTVKVTTVDEFLLSQSISRVGILKVDVEGFDMEVLKGATQSLNNQSIDFVLVECGFYSDDPKFVLFDDIRDFLESYDYRLFGIYDQQLSWSGVPHIQYVNACFCLG